jgi:hypothetical protein
MFHVAHTRTRGSVPYVAYTRTRGGVPYVAYTRTRGGVPYVAYTRTRGGVHNDAYTRTRGGVPYVAYTRTRGGCEESNQTHIASSMVREPISHAREVVGVKSPIRRTLLHQWFVSLYHTHARWWV